jgi:hypothetical protein
LPTRLASMGKTGGFTGSCIPEAYLAGAPLYNTCRRVTYRVSELDWKLWRKHAHRCPQNHF